MLRILIDDIRFRSGVITLASSISLFVLFHFEVRQPPGQERLKAISGVIYTPLNTVYVSRGLNETTLNIFSGGKVVTGYIPYLSSLDRATVNSLRSLKKGDEVTIGIDERPVMGHSGSGFNIWQAYRGQTPLLTYQETHHGFRSVAWGAYSAIGLFAALGLYLIVGSIKSPLETSLPAKTS